MHEYMTRAMVARTGMTYVGQSLQPGDQFMATPDDAGYFKRCGKADDAPPQVAKQAESPKEEKIKEEAPAPEAGRRRGRPTNAERAAREAAEQQPPSTEEAKAEQAEAPAGEASE